MGSRMYRTSFRRFSWTIAPLLLAFLPACGGGDSSAQPTIGLNPSAIADLKAAGVNKYIGKTHPSGPIAQSNGAKTYQFDKTEGPICLWGSQFSASVRDKGSENLLIYLQGGGACWTGACRANTDADPTMPQSGILNPAASNVVGSWNVVYVPYCDGSVFSGDNQLTDTVDPLPAGVTDNTRYHHGIQNLTAALDLAKTLYPNPKRVLLVGSSAGGYGTILGTAIVRFEYPTTPLIVFDDAGVGLAPADPTYTQIVSEWKFDQFIPSSCTGCKTDQTQVVAWGLRNDPSIRCSAFSSYNDAIIGGVFLQMQPDPFKALLLDKTGNVHNEFPDRYKRFFVNGSEHTTLILDNGNTTLGGYLDAWQFGGDGGATVVVSDWTKAFVNDTAGWVERMQ